MCREPLYRDAYARCRPVEKIISEIRLTRNLFCKRHDLDKVFFCDTCKLSVCPLCSVQEHVGHAKENLKTVYNQRKKSILTKLGPIEKVNEELKAANSHATGEIKKIETDGVNCKA